MAKNLSAKVIGCLIVAGLLISFTAKKLYNRRPLTEDEVRTVNSIEERKEDIFRDHIDEKYQSAIGRMNQLMEKYENSEKVAQKAMKKSVEEALYWTIYSCDSNGINARAQYYISWGKRQGVRPRLHD
jgi:hypothetical protein